VKAVLLFHMRVGARLALQSFTPLFSAIVALVMLQMYPAALIASIARQVFGVPSSTGVLLLLAALAFALPAWAAPRMAHGLNGWIRHLPLSSTGNRRGMALALVVVQAPLLVALAILAFSADVQGIGLLRPILVKLAFLITGAALTAVPAKNHAISGTLAAGGALLALLGRTWMLLPALALLAIADAVSGPLQERRARRPLRAAGALLDLRIAWRALAWRVVPPYLAAMLPLGFASLFIRNNELTGELLSGTARFGGTIAVTLLLSILSENLSVRRPVWPWARSLPRSSYRRVLFDALFLGAHAVVVLVVAAFIHAPSALAVLMSLPLLSSRAVGHMRRIPERRTGIGPFVMEGFFTASLIALLPWTVLLALAGAPAAFLWARSADVRQKVTRWLEKHHDAGGDSLSWSA
jgi:hypothetical protein